MLARSFLIESSSKLLVTRTGIKAWMSLISGRIRLLIWSYLPLNDENFTLLNFNIYEASWPILIQFYVWHHRGGIRFWGRFTLAHWTRVRDRCPFGYLFFLFSHLIFSSIPSLYLRHLLLILANVYSHSRVFKLTGFAGQHM